MSERDHVTGLESRGALEAFFEAHFRAQGGRAGPAEDLAMVMCDVIGLKEINARDGFAAGDAWLRRAAGRLQAAAADAATVARLGGDELVAVFTGTAAAAAAARAAATIAAGADLPLRAAATSWQPGESAAMVIDRLYATVRRC